jgi:predicted nucleic acid-binding protein
LGRKISRNKECRLARRYRLSSYDASYLELVLRNRSPIAARDEELRHAAAKAGVKIFKPK